MTFSDFTNKENNIDIIIPTLFFTIPRGLSCLCLISFMVFTLSKPLFNKKMMEKVLYPNHPVRCTITGSSNVGKSVFLTNLVLNFNNEYNKIYIYSPSLHQALYQKIINSFSNYITIHLIPNILNEEDKDIVIEEIVNNKDFEKSDNKIETYESIEELKFLQEYDDRGTIILDDLNEKELNDPRVKAMFKRSRQIKLSIFIISQDNYELPQETMRINGNIYHLFKPNNFLDVRMIYQDQASMDMTLDEFKYLTSTCWKEKYQHLTIHITKGKYCGRYRLGLNILFVPISSPF